MAFGCSTPLAKYHHWNQKATFARLMRTGTSTNAAPELSPNIRRAMSIEQFIAVADTCPPQT